MNSKYAKPLISIGFQENRDTQHSKCTKTRYNNNTTKHYALSLIVI